MLRRLAELLILPPASALLLLLCGLALRRRWRRLGTVLTAAAIAWLWLAATPWCGGLLLRSLQTFPALPANGPLPAADAIVVLSAEADRFGSEYGGPTIGAMTLQRLRYGASLQRRTGLPLLVSGGRPATDAPPLATMMAAVATHELGVPVRWLEDRSADTWENAQGSARLLTDAGVRRVLLVTSAWHMPRSVASFRAAGVEAIAAPTAFRGPAFESWTALLPHWTGLRDSCLALHEWAGRIAYAATH